MSAPRKDIPAKGTRFSKGASGPEVIFGFHSVYEAMRANRRRFDTVILSDRRTDPRIERIQTLAQEKGLPVQTVPQDALESLTSNGHHQGIAARVSPFPVQTTDQLFKAIDRRDTPFFVLMAESVEDTHNLGALIRTALCAGVDYILVPKNRSAMPSAGVSRSSAGAMEHADIFMFTNAAAVLKTLKEKGAWVSGLDADGDRNLFEADFTGNLVLVVGGEHKGVRPVVRSACDFIVSIPISGQINSLNASVAGSVAMYEALRQRSVK